MKIAFVFAVATIFGALATPLKAGPGVGQRPSEQPHRRTPTLQTLVNLKAGCSAGTAYQLTVFKRTDARCRLVSSRSSDHCASQSALQGIEGKDEPEMEQDTKILLGKVLGEIYRIQKRIQSMPCPVDDGQIYGLVNGFETAIDHELESAGFIAGEQVDAVADVLDPIFVDPNKLEEFAGFYDIEPELKSRGVDRGTAATILTYFYIKRKFASVIAKMDSSDSPTECRTFEPSEFEV